MSEPLPNRVRKPAPVIPDQSVNATTHTALVGVSFESVLAKAIQGMEAEHDGRLLPSDGLVDGDFKVIIWEAQTQFEQPPFLINSISDENLENEALNRLKNPRIFKKIEDFYRKKSLNIVNLKDQIQNFHGDYLKKIEQINDVDLESEVRRRLEAGRPFLRLAEWFSARGETTRPQIAATTTPVTMSEGDLEKFRACATANPWHDDGTTSPSAHINTFFEPWFSRGLTVEIPSTKTTFPQILTAKPLKRCGLIVLGSKRKMRTS